VACRAAEQTILSINHLLLCVINNATVIHRINNHATGLKAGIHETTFKPKSCPTRLQQNHGQRCGEGMGFFSGDFLAAQSDRLPTSYQHACISRASTIKISSSAKTALSIRIGNSAMSSAYRSHPDIRLQENIASEKANGIKIFLGMGTPDLKMRQMVFSGN
jgi:hypothetical protein